MIKIILLTITLLSGIKNETQLGGFQKQDNGSGDCVQALGEILGEFPAFSDYHVTHCETQLVNGTNYRMTLTHPNKQVKKCQIVVYKSLNGEHTPLKYRESSNDCFTQFENLKISTTSN